MGANTIFTRIERPCPDIFNVRELLEQPEAVLDEEAVVWLEDPAQFPYVREQVFSVRGRRRKPAMFSRGKSGRLVGYAVLRPDAENEGYPGQFLRRCWWVAPWDPYEGGGHPCEAVEPLSIRPGWKSEPSDR